MENYCKYIRHHVDLQLKFTVPSLLIKLVHNCYLNSLFFTALLKTWERNEKGTENMSDMPRSAPFTMQFFVPDVRKQKLAKLLVRELLIRRTWYVHYKSF